MSKCQMDHCNRAVKYPGLGICHACYLALYYWKRKSVKEIIHRKAALKLYEARLREIQPGVVVMPQRKGKRG